MVCIKDLAGEKLRGLKAEVSCEICISNLAHGIIISRGV